MEPYQASGSFSEADQLRYQMQMPKASLYTQEGQCRRIAQKAMDPYGTLPPTKSFELYLVQGIAIPLGGADKDARVIFPPEFIFVIDAGLEALVGVNVFWEPAVYGDPRFPEFSKSALRSIASRTSSHIIFSHIAGSIMIGTKTGVPDGDVRKDLTAAGLRNIQGSSGFWTAECQPFRERSICSELEKTLSYIKYANQNRVVRLVDFAPGWSCMRLT